MAWTKTKMAIAAGVVVILTAGTVTTFVIYQPHLPKARPLPSTQTDFPRSSWNFAGFGDPRSAFMSYMWASICQSNRPVFEASLTPSQKTLYRQMIAMNMKVSQPHSEAAAVADVFKRADGEWQNGRFRLIDEQATAADQVLLHLEAQKPNGHMEVYIRMRKLGNEWKFDGPQKRQIPATS